MKHITSILVIAIVIQMTAGFLIKDIIYEIAKSVLDDNLKEFLVSLKPMLKTGNSSLGIPVLDPYENDYQEIYITEDIISIKGDLTNAKVKGLSNYIVNEAKFKLAGLKITLNMTLSNVKAKSLYSFEAESKGISMYGKGDIDVEIFNFTFAAEAQLGLKSNKIFIKSLSTGMHLGNINFNASGIYNNQPASETINSIVSQSGPYVVNNLQWLISSQVDCRLTKLINSYLDGLTLQDIINIIGYYLSLLYLRECPRQDKNIDFATLLTIRQCCVINYLQFSEIIRTMKVLAALIVLVASCQLIGANFVHDGSNDLVRDYVVRAIGDKFKTALEDFKSIMKKGNAKLGIPVLDPLDLEHQKININEEQVTANGEINNAHVDGLSDYVVKHADFKIAKWNASMSFLWSNIKGKTAYEVDAYIANKIPVYGAGEISFDISDFAFSTQAKLKVNLKTKKVQIVSFSATAISVAKTMINITGLYNNDELSQLIGAVISDMAPDAIQDFQEEVTAQVDQILLREANALFDQYTLDDILGLIS
ncbi:uncharacterized protein LOC100679942 [Nasonia vitripennis]|uniref:Uncharacterized protein n=1 Tax=Nasonia vitripennis TaxID=7425 RepID=A0A7M7IS55_NASVI|nr:uncharacterized protein LOC100679942 [Nasonia vitripennis]